jgi:hypothetical protein
VAEEQSENRPAFLHRLDVDGGTDMAESGTKINPSMTSYMTLPQVVLLGFLIPGPMHTAPGEDPRLVKGNPMAKISLISWCHQKKKFLEMEAQRRARAGEQRTATDEGSKPAEALDVLIAAAPFELLEFDEEHLIEEQDVLALLNSNRTHNVADETFDAPAESCVNLDLTADQSHAILALPVFSRASEENAPHALFNSANRRIIERSCSISPSIDKQSQR